LTKVSVLPLADFDIAEAAEAYVEQAGLALGLEFFAACERTWLTLAQQPELGRITRFAAPQLNTVRRWQLEAPFEVYQVFYAATNDGLQVIRVLHGARDSLGRLVERGYGSVASG